MRRPARATPPELAVWPVPPPSPRRRRASDDSEISGGLLIAAVSMVIATAAFGWMIMALDRPTADSQTPASVAPSVEAGVRADGAPSAALVGAAAVPGPAPTTVATTPITASGTTDGVPPTTAFSEEARAAAAGAGQPSGAALLAPATAVPSLPSIDVGVFDQRP